MTDLDSADSVSVPGSHFLSVKGIKYWTSHGVTGRTKGCVSKRVTAANAQETTVLTPVTKAERVSQLRSFSRGLHASVCPGFISQEDNGF